MIDTVHIIHYIPNVERLEYLKKSNIFKNKNVIINTSFQQIEDIPKDYDYTILPKEMCVFLAHREVLTFESNNTNIFLIIEDDALINEFEDFSSFIDKVAEDFYKSDADVVFISDVPQEWNMKIPNIVPEKILYTDVKQCSLATHCYMVKPKSIPAILSNFKYNLPIDHEFNRLINLLLLKVAWTFPGVKQGTHTTKYKSNIR